MEGTPSPVFPLFSISPHSNFSLREKSRLLKIPLKSDHSTFQIRAADSADRNTASRVSPQRAGHFDPARKMQNLNSEVSPHRAVGPTRRMFPVSSTYGVSAVRLLRIDQGGAFADLLNDKGKNSSENEMCYVERTLGFRTHALDDRDIRLLSFLIFFPFCFNLFIRYSLMS
ncbi:uncharacterized protein LOC131255726 isoform X3 [Magnolia sinica]|uniref:uncharacterized protein LOC131255726 isoform X3 n=1 Tax=Magnolia sinica TaxID=86752 RepID=UPI002658CE50|nr:uncharacterized protein LOC131255726 isoform X3 [Magnolia sinica]